MSRECEFGSFKILQIRLFSYSQYWPTFNAESFSFFYRADNSSQKSHSSGGGGGYPMPQLTDPGGGGYYQQQQPHGPNSNGHHSDGASPGSSQLSVDGGRESTLITRTQKQHVTQNVSL
jgi:hypothetical protein